MKSFLYFMGWTDHHGKTDWHEIGFDLTILAIIVIGVGTGYYYGS